MIIFSNIDGAIFSFSFNIKITYEKEKNIIILKIEKS